MKKHLHPSTLAHYVLLYVSILLAACLVLGEVLIIRAAKELHTVTLRETEQRLQIGVDALETQLDTLWDVATRICASV